MRKLICCVIPLSKVARGALVDVYGTLRQEFNVLPLHCGVEWLRILTLPFLRQSLPDLSRIRFTVYVLPVPPDA